MSSARSWASASCVSFRCSHAIAFRCTSARGSNLVEHRIAYLGNAAQTLHPVAGQGLNLGLRDGAVLAELIGADLRSR